MHAYGWRVRCQSRLRCQSRASRPPRSRRRRHMMIRRRAQTAHRLVFILVVLISVSYSTANEDDDNEDVLSQEDGDAASQWQRPRNVLCGGRASVSVTATRDGMLIGVQASGASTSTVRISTNSRHCGLSLRRDNEFLTSFSAGISRMK